MFTSHFKSLVRQGDQLPNALTGGYRWGFWALAVFGIAAVVAALALIRREEMVQTPATVPTA